MSYIILISKLKFLSFFVTKPKKKLLWNKVDLEKGMKWAKTQPHPFKKGKTLWDLCYDKKEIFFSVDNLNKFLFNEI